VYSALSIIAIHFIGLHVLNAIFARSGYKWVVGISAPRKRKPASIISMQAGSGSSSGVNQFPLTARR
jgi:hypothetical protein